MLDLPSKKAAQLYCICKITVTFFIVIKINDIASTHWIHCSNI